jgi:uncharacterized protein YbjT (DUF2867 family)
MSSNKRRTILVTGATGKQGGALLNHLQQRGFPVRAFTRDAAKAQARSLQKPGMEVFQGNLDDRSSVTRALDGVNGVYAVQDSKPGFETEVRQGVSLADAANRSGIEQYVYSSVASADRNTGISHFESKASIEEHIRGTGLRYTILRPVFFMENLLGMRRSIEEGTLATPLRPETRLQIIAVDDIGRFAAMAFEYPGRWTNRTMEIAGDELSMHELTDALSLRIGRTVRYVQTPWDEFERQAGKEIATMFRWFEREGYHADLAAVRAEHAQTLGFAQWLNKFWPLASMAA